MKKAFVGIMIVLFGWGVCAVRAQPLHEGRGWQAELPKELKLSKEQKEPIKELGQKLRKELIPLRGQLEENQLDLQAETEAENPDMAKINRLIDESAKIRAEIAKKSIANKIAIAKLLTPEQREQWQELRQQRGRADRRPGHGFKRGMHPMPEAPCPAMPPAETEK